MKILITADWHIGIRSDSTLYHNIFNNWIDNFLIPQIKENNINELAILADIFNDRNEINVHTENIALDAFDRILKECNTLKIKLFIGNHDCYHRNSRNINSLNKFRKFERVEVIDSIQLRMAGEKELIYCPWLIEKKELIDFVAKYGKADILFGHFDINGFQLVKGIVEKKAWEQSFFKDNFTKVFSGHFHLRDTQNNITYVGNPFPMDWGDYGNTKGVYILDTETLQTTFIENTISPIYIKVYLSQLKQKLVDYDILTGNFVQLILDEDFTEKMLDKLQEVILAKNPLSFKVEGENKKVDLKIEDIQESISNPIEYLVSYIKELKLPEGIEQDRLVKETYALYKRSIE